MSVIDLLHLACLNCLAYSLSLFRLVSLLSLLIDLACVHVQLIYVSICLADLAYVAYLLSS